MAVFDITHTVIGVRTNIWDRTPDGGISGIVAWLNDNVGEYYGHGDKSSSVIRIGSGWEIFKLWNGKHNPPEFEDSVVTWHIDITDDDKSILFALKWIN